MTLTTGPLPSGVTVNYSANPLTPPATSVLTLYATADAALGPFRLDLTGTSTTVTNSTSSSVTVNFGLLPVCSGAVKGLVTDAETGLPLAKAQVALYGSSFYADAYTSGAQAQAESDYVAL